MIAPGRVAALLLAAGLSRRFGPEDKLLAPYRGQPLASHARDSLASIGFSARLAVVRAHAPPLTALFDPRRFTILANPDPDAGMASSIRLGVAAACAEDVDALLICLADMPRIDGALLMALCTAYDPAAGLLVTTDGDRRTPPALIGRRHFDTLSRLQGDAGARSLLADAPGFAVAPAQLLDIDRPTDG